MEVGNLLEPLVARIFAKKTGLKIYQRKCMFQHPHYPWMLADLDYLVELPDGKTAILEIKTTNYNAKDKWWYKHYKAQIEAHIRPALGAVKLSQLSPHVIQKFYNDLLTSGRSAPKRGEDGKVITKDGQTIMDQIPMSAKSVRIHGILTKALSVAVSIGYIKINPADCVTLPRMGKKEIHPLTDEQVKDFLQISVGDEYEILLKVILFTGLRESEAIGLTWDSIDFKAGTVKVSKQLQKRPLTDGSFVFAPLKNDKARILKPAPFVMEQTAAAGPGRSEVTGR